MVMMCLSFDTGRSPPNPCPLQRVKLLEIGRGEFLELDMAKTGNDVDIDGVAVLVECGVPDVMQGVALQPVPQ
jgi:hypothetical protein